jgi:LacI family transcriptional regulator
LATSVTITHIAEAAGVSTATVDRVLNRRPGVNPTTVQRVRDAMKELGGAVPMRGRPRSTDSYRFAFVLPATRRGFFDQVDRLIAQAAGDFRHQHITEVTRRLPADAAAFAQELVQLSDMDGVALLAPDTPPVKLAVNELVRAGVHVVTLFSDVAGSMRETFIGADNRAAGRTAGLLLGREAPAGQGHCALLSPATRYAAEIDRGIGFAQVLEERFAGAKLLRVDDMPESEDEAYRRAREALDPAATGSRLTAVYNVGPGSHGVHRALAEHGYDTSLGVVAHDLLDTHRAMLISGALTFVLHQDVHYVATTAARVLRALCEGVRGALAVSNPRVDILTAENLA